MRPYATACHFIPNYANAYQTIRQHTTTYKPKYIVFVTQVERPTGAFHIVIINRFYL